MYIYREKSISCVGPTNFRFFFIFFLFIYFFYLIISDVIRILINLFVDKMPDFFAIKAIHYASLNAWRKSQIPCSI